MQQCGTALRSGRYGTAPGKLELALSIPSVKAPLLPTPSLNSQTGTQERRLLGCLCR